MEENGHRVALSGWLGFVKQPLDPFLSSFQVYVIYKWGRQMILPIWIKLHNQL